MTAKKKVKKQDKKEFTYKEIDEEGMETLEVIANADKFNSWMYKTIKPYCKGTILEIGSGIGNISKMFLDHGFNIYLSDIRKNYCDVLKKKYGKQKHCKGVLQMDVVDPKFDQKWKDYFNKMDTIFALNVFEHIEDNDLAMANCRKLLKKDGHLIVLVPAYQALYNKFDEELYHYRRYNKKMLNTYFTENGYNIHKSFYFNSAGIPGWFVSGKIMKNKTIPEGQMKLYNVLVPLFKLGDKFFLNKFGLSVVSIGKK